MTSPAEPCVLSLPTQMSTRSYANAGCQAVFGSLDAAGFFELLNMNKKAALVIFIGRMMEELGVRHPEEKCVREVAEKAHATGACPKPHKWFLNDLHQYLRRGKEKAARNSRRRLGGAKFSR